MIFWMRELLRYEHFDDYRPGFALLHCTTSYPTPPPSRNLKAIKTLIDKFPDVTIGYSDHTESSISSILAVALGANVIEKHITLDNKMSGPDHQASLEPDLFKEMVKCIRNIEIALGDGIKKPAKSEIKNLGIVRKSLVAKKYIKIVSENVL